MVFGMLCVTASMLFRQSTMGDSKEGMLLALGKIPQPDMLSQKFTILYSKIQELGEENFAKVLENLSIYDLRMLAQVMTAVASEVGEARLILTRRSQLMSMSLGRPFWDILSFPSWVSEDYIQEYYPKP